MKRILFFLCPLTVLVASCRKVIDLQPDATLVPENAYASTAQIAQALSGIYTNLKYTIGYSQYYTAYLTAATDESYFYNTSILFTQFANAANDNSTGNPGGNLWRGSYQSINYANTMLDYIDVSSAGKVDAAIVRRAKGEAYFMRGFYYFLLAQWYGDVPLEVHSVNDPSLSQIARTPEKQVYDQIIADMTTADSLLYDQTFSSLGYSEKICRTGVEAMLARVCLYAAGQPVNDTKRYADALAWANKVVASNQHALVTPYSKIFTDEAQNIYNKENIWEIGFNQKGAGAISAGGGIGVYVGVSNSYTNGTSSAGTVLYDSGYVYSYLKLHPRLFFTYQAGDARRDWNIGNYSYTNAVKVPVANNKYWTRQPAKWRREYEPAISRSVQMTSNTNFPVIRYADVLLMLAEAENEVNGPTTTAYDAINQVRRRSISATKVVDSIGGVTGTGYTSAPAVTNTTGGGTGFAFNVVYTASNKTVQVLLTGQGSGYSSAPTITIGNQWAAGTPYTAGTQVASGGRLYTVTTAGTSTATAPTNTSGASSAATTGAVFTYAGVAATAYTILSPVPVVDLAAGLSKDQLRKAIQDERTRELCFEAVRQQDLKRWGILLSTIRGLADDINGANTTFPLIPSVVSELGVGMDATPLSPVKNVSEKDMFLPIPLNDLNLNKLLKQNPGY